MTKKEFSRAKRYRFKTRGLKKLIKLLKKFRYRKARRGDISVYLKTDAWEVS